MKIYKADAKNTELIIQKLITKNYSFPVLSEDVLKELSTDKVTVLAARMDDDYDVYSRHLSGYARLNNPIIAEEHDIHAETNYVHFWFDIYSSHQTWNEMSYIQPFFLLPKPGLKDDLDSAIDAQVLMQNTVWGQNGIYEWMPTHSLSEDDLNRRLFVKQVQSVSRKYKWAQEMKKEFQKFQKQSKKAIDLQEEDYER